MMSLVGHERLFLVLSDYTVLEKETMHLAISCSFMLFTDGKCASVKSILVL